MARSSSIRSEPREELARSLHKSAIHLLRRLRREDESLGVGAARLSALSVLVFGGACTLGELAALEQVRPPTMTRVVQALAAAGLVRVERDQNDARSVRVAATAAGRRLLLAGRERRVRAFAALLAPLSAAELRDLARAAAILERILAPAQESAPAAARANQRSPPRRRPPMRHA
jgi:DNA-binding MarR family transcriptional regulator